LITNKKGDLRAALFLVAELLPEAIPFLPEDANQAFDFCFRFLRDTASAHGSVAGHYDVFLNGIDLSNLDDVIDEGPRLEVLSSGVRSVVWDDETTVWLDEVPK